MKVVDPGHEYLLDSYDGGEPVRLVFVKREGEGYPFNVGHHPGTNCQEVIRVLIDRMKYLQRQIACKENPVVIDHLRAALWQFEQRAAERHGRILPPFRADIENRLTCLGCGHIGCNGRHHAKQIITSGDSEAPEVCTGKAADWFPIENAPKDEPVWLFGPSLIDEDYNTKGVVEGYWLDDLGWMGAVWNNEQDYWESKQVNPTHWMPIPQPPTEIKG